MGQAPMGKGVSSPRGKSLKKGLKTFLLVVQDRSRSSMLINLKSLSPVLVMISSRLCLSATVFTLHEPIAVK